MSRGVHPLAGLIAAGARGVSGVPVRWVGCKPEVKQRIYFANHTSHLDFVVLWSALPGKARERTRPVAAKDYWNSGIRAYLAQKVFRAALIHRRSASQTASSESSIAEARMLIDQLTDAMGETDSLIIFPEGTRGTGESDHPLSQPEYTTWPSGSLKWNWCRLISKIFRAFCPRVRSCRCRCSAC